MNSDIKLVDDLIKIAAVMNTKDQKKTGKSAEELGGILSEGCMHIQTELFMLQAFKTWATGKPKIVKRVLRIYDRITKEYVESEKVE